MTGPVIAMVVAVLSLVAGAVLLTVGAEAFTENVSGASSRLGVSVLTLGLLVAGAEPEEAVTAMVASGQAHPALAAGDAVGANLIVLTVALGIAAVVAPLPVSRRAAEYAVGAAVAGALAAVLLWNGVLGRFEGAVLVGVYVVAVAYVWRRERQPPVVGELAEHPPEQDPVVLTDAETSRALLVLLLGVLGMVVGGYLAVRGAGGLVDVFDVRESVVGLTVLALATSAEMIALVWAARRKGVPEVLVAGVIGAVAYNATVTLGLAGLVNPLVLGQNNPVLAMAAVTAALPLVLLAGRRTGTLPRLVGGLLVLAYVASVAWLLAG